MFYWFAWVLCQIWFFLLGGVSYQGRENIPESGAFIAAGNHRAGIDPFLLGMGLHRQMAFLAKDSLFRIPVVRTLLRWVNATPINRSGSPKEVMDKTVELLKKGTLPTTIFPEGTRNLTEDPLIPFKGGAALLAIEAGVPIVPCAIVNSNRFFGHKVVRYGTPIQPPGENDKKARNDLTDALRTAILDLLAGS